MSPEPARRYRQARRLTGGVYRMLANGSLPRQLLIDSDRLSRRSKRF
jgi:hypothetical protein